MILEYQKFDLFGKTVFERIVQKTPFGMSNELSDEACFLYLEEGEYKVSTLVSSEVLHAREAVLLRCGSYYAEFVKTITSDHFESIVVHLHRDILKRIYENEPESLETPVRPVPAIQKYVSKGLVQVYISSLRLYFDNLNLVNENLVILKLKELILVLTKSEEAGTVANLISSLFSPREADFHKVIEDHLYTKASLDDLARLTHLSTSSFKREFARLYEAAPARYLKARKLDKAVQLLEVTALSMSEIADQCGFHDQVHLTKAFRARYGSSPSAYRMSQKRKILS